MIEGRTIEKVNIHKTEQEEEYYKCIFKHCDFSNQTIRNIHFEDCEFIQCDFTLSRLLNTFRETRFIDCKMTGADFTGIGKFSFSFRFEKSYLGYASFIGLKMKNTVYKECNLHEAYFDETDLAGTIFDRCDLTRTSFYRTNLEKADFSTSYNFNIDPSFNRLKKTIFSENELKGLVAHLDIIIEK